MRLLYLSPLPWRSFEQRPHKFVRWFHNEFDAQVTWVEPYASRWPKIDDIKNKLTTQRSPSASADLPEWLELIRPRSIPIEPILQISFLNHLLWQSFLDDEKARCESIDSVLVVGKPSELALLCVKHLKFTFRLYDAMDDFPAFHSGGAAYAMAKREKLIAESVDCVMASSTSLTDKFTTLHRDAVHIGNGYDAEQITCPALQQQRQNHLSKPKNRQKVFGYVGTIAAWFDWRWLIDLACKLPKVQIHLTGPIHCNVPNLPPNIKLFQACNQNDALMAMAEFDVGLIPFLRTRLTDGVDPIKYHEYRALGLPVLSTIFGDMPLYARTDKFLLLSNQLNACILTALETMSATSSVINSTDLAQDRNWSARFSEVKTYLLKSN